MKPAEDSANGSRKVGSWIIAFWILLVAWVLGAGLNMARFNGGFLTNYLADVAFPTWFYIYIRGLHRSDGKLANLVGVGNWFGQTSERALLSIFVVGLVTELKTQYWPTGPITGTFDVWDLAAYASILLICYGADRYQQKRMVV